jgi:hypothetical protein
MNREQLIPTLLAQQNNKCFICEQPLDPALHKIEVDHIIPRARGGKDDDNNYAATHDTCNRDKADADLRIARCMARYERLKEEHGAEGPNRPNLGDFLSIYGGGKYQLRVSLNGNTMTYTLPEFGPDQHQAAILRDKLSGLEYAFLELPIEYIHHDFRINPRAVGPRIRGLLSEFMSGRPQLHVALAWGEIDGNHLKVHVFDGQHKVVAQMLLGTRRLPVRLFINPDINLLLETNTNAGTILKQVAFDQATQRYLGSQLYWDKIDAFRVATQRVADDLSFSERDLVDFFRGERREVMRYILDDVRTAVTHHSDNKLKDYIEFSGREGDKPLSYSTIEKTFFSFFISKSPLTLPLNYKLEVGEHPRQLEKEQIRRLFNLLAERAYIGGYDFDIGANKIEERVRKGDPIPEQHIRAVRISREEILFNLLRYVRDLIKRFFLMRGQVIEDSELFQHKFPEELWALIDKLLCNLLNLPLWFNKQLSGTAFGVRQDHDYWKSIFERGTDRNGVQVLAKSLNLDELIQ